MNQIENPTAVGEGDEWPCGAVGHVHNDVRLAKIHFFEVEARSGFLRDALKVDVENLVTGHFLKIYVQLADCIDDLAEIFSFFGWKVFFWGRFGGSCDALDLDWRNDAQSGHVSDENVRLRLVD